ncbi:MAG: hypothetical protein UX09_C0006G0023 [Candidatus Uhrbacteria bacterium GW2011_GWE2_45_35]|uniref:Uncharacterized protein n=1 Tax=Candidatus Uhrbacteria bacterium GW2011_GWE2_45_35 TaxID=1618993 RepID=A0A0G1MLN1_9BACT|nr:MAG: hypothetical protein UX09_C0006G0023 [Candidatus Uhrbacteria bacterium GW2011_GWE2_45_35]
MGLKNPLKFNPKVSQPTTMPYTQTLQKKHRFD